MDLLDLLRIIWRRRHIVISVVLLALGLAVYVQVSTPRELEATGYLQWVLPEYESSQSAVSADINPVELSGEIDIPGNASYSVSPIEGRQFVVSAAASTADEASGTVDEIIEALQSRFNVKQEEAGIPAGEQSELRLAVPEVAVSAGSEGSFVASAAMFVYSPLGDVVNPYRADPSTGRLLQVAIGSDARRQRFEDEVGEDVEFAVGQESRDAAALLQVLVRGPDEGRVLNAFDFVAAMLNEDLDERQARADVPPSIRISLAPLDAPLEATDVSPPVTRAAIGIIVLGGLLALGTGIAVDEMPRLRRAWSSSKTEAAPDLVTVKGENPTEGRESPISPPERAYYSQGSEPKP